MKIVEIKKPSLTNATLIEGFPGVGLIGTIAASYIIEQLNMTEIGYLTSPRFPPMATIHNSKPHYPARIYESKKKNIYVLLSEFVVPLNIVYDLSYELMNWVKKNKIKRIISMSGVACHGDQCTTEKIYGIASNDLMADFLKKNNIEIIKEGVTTGVSGVLMAECAATNYPAITVLAPTEKMVPDPRAATKVISTLNKIFDLGIDVKPLMKESDKIEARMQDLLQKVKESHSTYKNLEDQHAPMYV